MPMRKGDPTMRPGMFYPSSNEWHGVTPREQETHDDGGDMRKGDTLMNESSLEELRQRLFARRCDDCRVNEGHEHRCHSIGGQREIMSRGEREYRYCECEECGVFILQAINGHPFSIEPH